LQPSNWGGKVRDIAVYPAEVNDPAESVLANSVNAADYDLTVRMRPGDTVLEIGCGSASWLLDHLPEGVHWEGVDVFEVDGRGRKSVATRLGSVHQIPFANNTFDWVLSNQSIEHWFEYGVGLEEGIAEIARVLKVSGQAHINFPFHLHGHPFFVTGDLSRIKALFDPAVWDVAEEVAYLDSGADDYLGWERCKFPYDYVARYGAVSSSYVVNLVLTKISDHRDAVVDAPERRRLVLKPRLSPFKRALAHGFGVWAWKVRQQFVRSR